jgi:hypothetical protein
MSGREHQIRVFSIITAILAASLVGLTSCPAAPTSPSVPAPTVPPASTPAPASPPEPVPSSPLAPMPAPAPTPPPTHEPAPPVPSPAPTPAHALANIPKEILAAQFGFLGASFDARELTELGITWDRPHPGPFIWGRIEKERGKYDWGEVDRYVQEAQHYSFATVATIWSFAGWDQAGLDEIVPGTVAVLMAEVKQWSHGNTGYSLKDSLVMEQAGEGFVRPRFGFSQIGTMEVGQSEKYVKIVSDVLEDLESQLRGWEEYQSLEKTVAEIGRLNSKLRGELAVIRLRRIVPGRCRYCPL